ncbi:hypothetical protein WA158_004202 [Blastocystis sp. Blastoise]
MPSPALSPNSSNSKSRLSSKCFFYFLMWIPVFTLGFSIILRFTGLTSYYYIDEFNNIADKWNNKTQEYFEDQGFNLTYLDNKYSFSIEHPEYSIYYPTQDSCTASGVCQSVEPSIFEYSISKSKELTTLSFVVDQEEEEVVTVEDIPLQNVVSLHAEDIGCVLVNECSSLCTSKNGSWNSTSASCIIPTYLNSLCYRILYRDDHWTLDNPSSLSVAKIPMNATGCEYNNQWKSEYYSSIYKENVTVQLQYYEDPYIYTSALTHGCNSKYKYDNNKNNCFGLDAVYFTILCYVIGGVSCILLVLEAIILLCMFIRCRKSKMS